jgi:hypothetical protein
MFPEGSRVEDLVLHAAVFSDGAFGRWLDHEVSDLINGLHWWIHNLMPLLGDDGNFGRYGIVRENRLLGACSRREYLVPPCCCLSAFKLLWGEPFSSTMSFAMMFLLCYRLKSNRASWLWTETSEILSKISLAQLCLEIFANSQIHVYNYSM